MDTISAARGGLLFELSRRFWRRKNGCSLPRADWTLGALIVLGLATLGSTATLAEVRMSWRLAHVYWNESAPNPTIRIVETHADSLGGRVVIEHGPWISGCEGSVTVTYQWRFDRDISAMAGEPGSVAFEIIPNVQSDGPEGCWGFIGWGPVFANDAFGYACVNPEDHDSCSSRIFRDGGLNTRSNVKSGRAVFREVHEDYEGRYEVSIGAQGVPNGWIGKMIYAFAQDRGQADAGTSTFVDPMVNGHRVDRCLVWADQCDQPAADRFCRDRGFSSAKRWRWEYTQPTITLGGGQVCTGDKCGGFSLIECLVMGQ